MEKKTSRNKCNRRSLESAIYVSWEESEMGWGTRPDGFSLHKTESDYRDFEKEYWDRMPSYVPDEYSRPAGSPTKVSVSKNLYEKLRKTKNGMRMYDETSLVRNGDLIFVSERSGWVPVE